MASKSSPRHSEAFSRSVYYSLTDEVPGLTDEEKQKLEAVMQKAEEFEVEETNKLWQQVEGQLYKYTNVMKGWQYRWFVLTPETGMLEYYMLDERKKDRPRGSIHLAGAVVSINEEDSQLFLVSAVCGEVFKLKAIDAIERKFWTERIRYVTEHHSKAGKHASKAHPLKHDIQSSSALGSTSTFHVSSETVHSSSPNHAKPKKDITDKPPGEKSETSNVSIIEIKESVFKAIECQKVLAKSIEDLPFSGPNLKCSNRELLILKATSQAAVQSLEQCYLILRRRQQESQHFTSMPMGTPVDWLSKSGSPILKRKSSKKVEMASKSS